MVNGLQGEALLRALLELCEEAVVEVDLDGKIARWNRGAECLYGYTEAEMTGQSMAQIVPIYEIAGFEALLRDLQRGEVRKKERTERLKRDGDCVVVNVRRATIRDA